MVRTSMETVRLRIEGMGCEGCVATVQEALAALPGVRRVAVALDQGTAEVEVEAPTDRGALVAAVEAAGYDADSL